MHNNARWEIMTIRNKPTNLEIKNKTASIVVFYFSQSVLAPNLQTISLFSPILSSSLLF